MSQRFLSSIVAFFAVKSALAFGAAPPSQVPGLPIDRAREHSEGIYRGARPEQSGTDALDKFGMKTIIDLEDDDAQVAREKAQAESLGMVFISSPMSGTKTPDDKQVDHILALIQDPANYPVYVHCHYGKDRTGLIMGLDRVLFQGWQPKDAYQEMLDVGFNPILVKLKNYFKKRTGMSAQEQKDLFPRLDPIGY